ncbi:retrotransposon gag protein [Cucumis melo var. makuwa]|uniref:Retrotransposon gag protein n=1 Tax=Cucumis melo var. makuwa TaxID=1194695 RepID=A0A5A7V596_CUCMM|nr:retrotransposon gag protein [Cucumis melo var. makuwa]
MIRVIRRDHSHPIVLMFPSGKGKGRGKLASNREGSVTCHMGTQFCFRVYVSMLHIQLLECKRSKQAGKVDDPNYCKYHRVISHTVEKCFVLKELILKLAHENKIKLDIDEVAQTNHVAVNMTSSVLPSILLYDQRESLIQFGTFESILVRFQQKIMTSNPQNKEPIEDEGE